MPDQTAVPTYAELMDRAIRAEEKIVRLISDAERTEELLTDERDRARARIAELEAERERDRKALDTLTRMANRAGEFYGTICALIDADPEDAGMLPSVADQVATEHRGLRARIVELEAQQQAPVAYTVIHRLPDGELAFTNRYYLDRAHADQRAADEGAAYSVVELREANNRG